jgi:transcriptional regulator CtsR
MKKMFNIRKKSIFNDWSVSENQFNIVLYNKIYTIKKMYVVEKTSQGGSFYNIKLLSQNI